YINYSSIGIEHEGFAGSPFTDAQYRATADLLRWLNTHLALHLNWTRNTVFGHENVPDGGHVDPGTGWNWPYFMSLLTGTKPAPGNNPHLAAVIIPRAYVRTCPAIDCTLIGTANWGEQYVVLTRRNGWVNIDFDGMRGWIIVSAVDKGHGTIVRIA